jgi:hypothetical protein
MATTTNYYKSLAEVPIKDKVEKKGMLDYLSWANAWNLIKLHYPDAQRVVYESPMTGLNYFTDGKTAYVKVGIIVNGIEHIDYLPIMDFRNNSIPVERITSQDVNKTIQRSTAKAIAMHGLGLQLWIGEDIVDSAPVISAPKKPAMTMPAPALIRLVEGDANYEKVVSYIRKNNESMTFASIMDNISKKYAITDEMSLRLKDEYDGETEG